MTQPYQRLFNTIQEIAAAGKVKLSADERDIIERETKDLINKSQAKNYKFASTVPQGFETLLEDLRGADAETAYKLVVDFMDEPDEGGKPDMMGSPDMGGDKPEFLEKGDADDKPAFLDDKGDGDDKPAPFEKKDDDDKFEDKEDDKDDKPAPFEKKDDDDKGESDDKDDKSKDKDKDDKAPPSEKKDDKPDKEENPFADAKEKVMARIRKAQEGMLPKAMPEEMDGKPIDKGDGGPKLDGKGPHGPGKDKMKDLKEKVKDQEKKPSMDEMGIDDKEVDPTISLRAKKIRVKVTGERNVIAYHEDHGPIFMLTPTDKTKASKQALKRLATRAYGLALYKGFTVAAKTLGARMLHTAGVDDDVEVVTEEEPEAPVTQGILEDADSVIEEEPEEKDVDDDTQAEADDDIEQEPAKIARYTKIIKNSADGDIAAGAETVSEETPDARPSDVTEGDDDVTDAPVDTPSSTVIDDDVVDFTTAKKKLEADYRKLYASRLKKAEEAFVTKFARCMRVASKRMLLNHDENPWKVASADVLMSEDVEFENGERFRAMSEHIAVQLTELISTEGHDPFVRLLMDRTADLMEKSDPYLKDIESDLARLRPMAAEVSSTSRAPRREARANTMRRAASAGNFGLADKAASAPPVDTKTSLRNAMKGRDSRVNRDLGRLRK